MTVVSVGGGLAYGALGYSHHAVQDYALMRSFPHMLIAAPGDPMEVRACMRYLVDNPQPSYLRLGKAGEPNFHVTVPRITPGSWLRVASGAQNHGSHEILLSTGATLGIAMNWHQSPEFAHCDVYSMPLWSMQSKSLQKDCAQTIKTLHTLEDHLLDGGFGSWMMEALMPHTRMHTRIQCHSLSAAVCGMVGSQSLLNDLGGLSKPTLFDN